VYYLRVVVLLLLTLLPSSKIVEIKVSSEVEGVPIDVLAKRYDRDLYVFAVPMRKGATNGSFIINGLTGYYRAEVIGENRFVEVVDGKFKDTFDTYQVHRYRIINIL